MAMLDRNEALRRWDDLELLRKEWPEFNDFLHDVMTDLLGFNCSDIQRDIGDFLDTGPKDIMIQAQRSQAKTTITAAYCVYSLIQDPTTRVLILSAGETQAKEIANWIIQIIMNMEELDCLRPGPGDRQSGEAFDVHKALKGPEKSPSVACVSITGNLQGKRADILIADDIESSKNSRTSAGRELLKHLIKDFASICTNGRIIYLGTPQSVDSIYNDLPGQGFDVRIWPGRYPTDKELPNYGPHLAPLIRSRIEADPSLQTGGGLDGTRGQAIDPVILPEEVLVKKEEKQGAAYFQLQHMLDTRLTDAERYPLKLSKIGFFHLNSKDAPLRFFIQATKDNQIIKPPGFPIPDPLYRVGSVSDEYGPYQGTHMFIDPAGGGLNGDETGWAVSRYIAGYITIHGCGGVRGGYDEETMDQLIDIMVKFDVGYITIEENYGHGALRKILTPRILKRHAATIDPVWHTGQKELRIIETLEPIIGAGRLILDEDIVAEDIRSIAKYPVEKRASYSLFQQLARLTRDKGSLGHDDRLEALAGTCAYWAEQLDQDDEKAQARAQKQQWNAQMKSAATTMGKSLQTFLGGGNKPSSNRAINRFKRR